jgi:hypothetical protein
MILADLRDYLSRQKRAGLTDLAQHFDTDPEALRGMLAMLERKGRVRELPTGTLCGSGCCKCDPQALTLFEWVNEESMPK